MNIFGKECTHEQFYLDVGVLRTWSTGALISFYVPGIRGLRCPSLNLRIVLGINAFFLQELCSAAASSEQ